MNATRTVGTARSARRARPFFYVGMALLMIAIALAGFWPRYYGPLVNGTPLDARSSHLLIHVHSTLFFGWLFMLTWQAMLVRSGRTALHRRAGPWLAGYGFAIAGVGMVTGAVLSARRAATQGLDAGATFLFVTFTDMLVFLGFLAAAVVKRRDTESHKRLMVLATWSLAIVGFSRLIMRMPGFAEERWWLGSLVLPLPALIGMAYDWRTRGRIHPVWLIGAAVFVFWANRGLFALSEAWLPIGRILLKPLLN